jgi:heptosyltransferase-2
VVLGSHLDERSVKLGAALKSQGKAVLLLADLKPSVAQIAGVIANCRACVSVDTGFAHIAQSFQRPTVVIMGPTHPNAGFGPWAKNARVVRTDPWCSPCGKDGRNCMRQIKGVCLTALPSDLVTKQLTSLLEREYPKDPGPNLK